MRLMSISRVGRASRIAIIGTSVCPPAITRAPSSAASHAQASSISAARQYSNGAAFMKRYAQDVGVVPRTARVRYCRSVDDMVKVPIALSQPQKCRLREPLRPPDRDRVNGRAGQVTARIQTQARARQTGAVPRRRDPRFRRTSPRRRRRAVDRPRLRHHRGDRAQPRRHRPRRIEQARRPAQFHHLPSGQDDGVARLCAPAQGLKALPHRPPAVRARRQRARRDRNDQSRRAGARRPRARRPAKARISRCRWATPWWCWRAPAGRAPSS